MKQTNSLIKNLFIIFPIFILISCKQTYGFKMGYDYECLESNAYIMLNAMEQYWGRDIIQKKLMKGDQFFYACNIDKDGYFVNFVKIKSTFNIHEIKNFEIFLQKNKTFFYICISYPYGDKETLINEIQRRYDNNNMSIIKIGIPGNIEELRHLYHRHENIDTISTDTI